MSSIIMIVTGVAIAVIVTGNCYVHVGCIVC
jgi:hypothetical protein